MSTAGVFNNMHPNIKLLMNKPGSLDGEINILFDYFFSKIPSDKKRIMPTSSGCWVIQGHGDDQDINKRKTILQAMTDNYSSLIGERNGWIDYINNHITLSVAMGLPGPFSPMGFAQTEGRWEGYTTSEIDVQLVRHYFELFDIYVQKYRLPVNSIVLNILHTIIRHQLRANFEEIWNMFATTGRTPQWMRPFYKLMAIEEIWVQKVFQAEPTLFSWATADKAYYLRPNIEESPELRVHEGIHLIDERNTAGQLLHELIISSAENFDANNIEFIECRNRLIEYFRTLYPDVNRSQERTDPFFTAFNTIISKINERTETNVMLSDIILLGYLLKIDYLQLYDPTCRPISDETRQSQTRTGAIYITGIDPYKHETMKRLPSFGGKKRNKHKTSKKITKNYA